MKFLPACLSPKPEELMSSWFARLAYNHWITPQQLYQYLFSKHKRSLVHAHWLDQAPETVVNTLATCTLTPYERIQQTLITNCHFYQQASINYQPTAWLVKPVAPSHRYSVKVGMMYCPQCLANDEQQPYFRQRWRLSFIVACLNCQVMLQDRCPNCYTSQAYLRIRLTNKTDLPYLSTCWRCDFNLALAPTVNAPFSCLTEHVHLLQQLTRVEATDVNSTLSFFFLLHESLKVLLLLIRKGQLTLPLKSINSPQFWRLSWGFDQMPIEVRAELLHWALRLMATGHKHYQLDLAVHRLSKLGDSYKYPTTRLFLYFRELLMNRSIEELVPLFGPQALID